MPEGDGGEAGDGSEAGNQTETSGRTWERATICVSSQVGCAVDCQFCLTALLGIKRNLTAGEIVGQVCAVLNDQRRFSATAPHQSGLHGDGRTFPELRKLHEGGPAAGGRGGNPGVAYDGINGRDRTRAFTISDWSRSVRRSRFRSMRRTTNCAPA